MKSHDGGISVYSQPGEGTKFHLYFPVIESEAVIHEVETKPIPRGHGERILFVDDEVVLASLGKRLLELLGYSVTAKTNPLEALAAVRAEPDAFALVVTDLTMPGMDGEKLGSQLLLLRPQLPIIITTGYSPHHDGGAGAELGFSAIAAQAKHRADVGRSRPSRAASTRLKIVPKRRSVGVVRRS